MEAVLDVVKKSPGLRSEQIYDKMPQHSPEALKAALARMRQLRAEGKGAKAIVAALTLEGFPYRGCGWHLTTVRRLLARQDLKAPTA